MLGVVPKPEARPAHLRTCLENLAWVQKRFEEESLTCMLEPINDKVSVPGYFLTTVDQALEILEHLKFPSNMKLQLDIFHRQIMSGGITACVKQHLLHIGHIQVAQVPDRREPSAAGEINYNFLFSMLDDVGYTGWVGAEYTPSQDTKSSLEWLRSG
eukprot:m.79127 g.79127  ORF g.79127 m.79127 type:complete len:157 (-) comp20825_c0_seq3:18-488(-)